MSNFTSIPMDNIPERKELICWACWEPEVDSKLDPLIRACRGCKDPNLQYIHQNCMNTYICNNTQVRFPGNWTSHTDNSGIPFVSQESLNLIRTKHNEETVGVPFVESETEQANLLASPTLTLQKGWVNLRCMDLRCTRCTDQYDVVARPVSSFRVLSYDRIMRTLVSMMTLCIMVLGAACAVIIFSATKLVQQAAAVGQDVTDQLQIRMWILPQPIDIRVWAAGMMSIFFLAYAITVMMVLRHCGGYSEIMVLGKKVEKN
jgi:hypothetical protein